MTKQENFTFDVEVGKILNLMINSLYTNKDIALRELISNASDACDKLRYLGAQDASLLKEELKISISTNKKEKLLIIEDNGVGMNKEDLIENLGCIAKSGTENFIKSLSGDKKKDVELIGQFGVGFYSSFMIANKVEVISRKYNEEKAYKWTSHGAESFDIEEGSKEKSGTQIILHLKDEATSDFTDRFHIKHVVETYSNHINFKVEFIPENLEAGAKIEVLNSASALWMKNPSEVSEADYENFFRNISHLPHAPFMTLHNHAEGLINYTNLLFIPSSKPFDLFHPDRKTSVKLYVKKVFISEELNLVPAYLRFVRGLIDCQDLPLNISRENLQHSAMLDKIRNAIINKILGELKKKSKENKEEYLKFWDNFGAVLKEGLCETSQFREKTLELCRFYSSKSDGKLITLQEYLERTKENQNKIYFLTGESLEKIKSSPQLEMFLAKDVEVLFLTDAVDEFWVTVSLPYKFKEKSFEFASINRGDVDIEEQNKAKEEDAENSEKPKEKDVTNSTFDDLINFFKETLGEKVSDVKISKKLTNSPVCLAVDSKGMDIRLERFLLEQKQLAAASAKILEINAENQIIKNLNEIFKDEARVEIAKDKVKTLFDLACIIEDEPIKDAGDFSRRLQQLMV